MHRRQLPRPRAARLSESPSWRGREQPQHRGAGIPSKGAPQRARLSAPSRGERPARVTRTTPSARAPAARTSLGGRRTQRPARSVASGRNDARGRPGEAPRRDDAGPPGRLRLQGPPRVLDGRGPPPLRLVPRGPMGAAPPRGRCQRPCRTRTTRRSADGLRCGQDRPGRALDGGVAAVSRAPGPGGVGRITQRRPGGTFRSELRDEAPRGSARSRPARSPGRRRRPRAAR